MRIKDPQIRGCYLNHTKFSLLLCKKNVTLPERRITEISELEGTKGYRVESLVLQ